MDAGRWYLPRGRMRRRVFWLRYFLPILAVQVAAGTLDVLLGLAGTAPATGEGFVFSSTAGPIGMAASLATLVPTVASTVTRLHDRGHSAWWLLLLLVPLVGVLVLVVQTWFLRGQDTPNRHGPPPHRSVPAS
ncbi:Uncharacterized membrane protein YhaH, DUF805 family [Geodermatophilus pulveris]|uniref:Uncharacterized membrane protein YhaH, DUF805 family n=1 Tax=Geodermatophilus pulveris TaxID=1564159 RepID=A0A239AXG7_9ACTN|nr:DUF805 domain-containing protein [Geodermatophilus pulveris]SNS00189.1 Uncharacterized membrane protein YhaH, DUF805 family [Geodermatophilus pulveris]